MSRFRTVASRLAIVSGLTVAAISGSTTLADMNSHRNNAVCQSNALQQQQHPKDRAGSIISGWDSNWDCRQPLRRKTNEDDNSEDVVKPTASRHVILVRHGQYVKDSDPKKKILTEIGR